MMGNFSLDHDRLAGACPPLAPVRRLELKEHLTLKDMQQSPCAGFRRMRGLKTGRQRLGSKIRRAPVSFKTDRYLQGNRHLTATPSVALLALNRASLRGALSLCCNPLQNGLHGRQSRIMRLADNREHLEPQIIVGAIDKCPDCSGDKVRGRHRCVGRTHLDGNRQIGVQRIQHLCSQFRPIQLSNEGSEHLRSFSRWAAIFSAKLIRCLTDDYVKIITATIPMTIRKSPPINIGRSVAAEAVSVSCSSRRRFCSSPLWSAIPSSFRAASGSDVTRHRTQQMQQSVELTPSPRILLAQCRAGACCEVACCFGLTCGSEGLKARAQNLAQLIVYRRGSILGFRSTIMAHYPSPSEMPRWRLASGLIISGVHDGS
ncbi:hypothetical protein CHELA1G11_30104 [Hyphomicrobiales bacterium]|nr:hypothetical protein CHELA1G11_30104 [Hyphomicrobiales bacterium]